jgi:VWFA-related protein
MRPHTLLGICLLVAAAAGVGAQAPAANPTAQRPTFRGGINYVKVDMYASTRDGTPIDDLAPAEIELLEDGKPQTIKDFEHVQVATGTPQDLRVEPNTIPESRDLASDARARVFVIFLDTYHTTIEGSATMRQPLIRFIDRLVGPEDLVAVMTPEMGVSDITFGRKTTVIEKMLEREWTWGRRDRSAREDPKEDLYTRCFPPSIEQQLIARRREKLTFDALADLVTFLQGVRDERKAVITVSDGWLLYSPNPDLAKAAGLPTAPLRLGAGTRNRGRSVDDDAECSADIMALAELDDSFRLREITDAANRTNVTFYPVYARGLPVFDSSIGQEARPSLQDDAGNLRARQESMRALALDTDGTAVIGTNDVETGLKRIVADLSSYYLLGYESTNNKLDGKYRSISVKVTRPGVEVRARTGYRSLTADEVMTRTDNAGQPGSNAAASPAVVVNPRAAFRLRSTAWTSGPSGTPTASVWLVGELDFATRKDIAWSNGGTAEISVVSAAGDRVASLQVPFATTDGAFTVRIPADKPFTPGDYAVRVRVTPQVGQSLPLSDLAKIVVPSDPTPLGESLMQRRGPSTGPRYMATADPRFRRTDRLRLEIPTQLDGAATARMLDRTGKPLQIPVTTSDRRDDSGGFRWIVADATLAPLAPGDYAIEVSVGDAKQVTPFQVVP